MGASMANFLPFPTCVQGSLLLSEDLLYLPFHLALGGLLHETSPPDTLLFDGYHDF